MPPDNQRVPPVVVTGSTPERKTHIEVCVRLRPLTIGTESSSSFFGQSSTRLRKPQVPSRTSRFGFSTPARRGKFDNHQSPQQETKQPDNTVYAWNLVSEDTMKQSSETDIVIGRTHQYTLDRAYGPETTTKQLYDSSVQDLVHAAMDGYHASVLAYGQTSTGKTHTMTGTPSQPGIVPLAVRECFDYLKRQDNSPREYLLRVSYLEVYKEHIKDLLSKSATPPPVRLFESADGLIIRGITEEVVGSPEQVFQILARGEAKRQVGATNLNLHSSRSHVIVRLWIESKSTTTTTAAAGPSLSAASSMSSEYDKSAAPGGVRVSSLSLVDLAGSESIRLSGTTERREEGHYINKSLMTLGKVVYALSEVVDETSSKRSTVKHVPYRDSKLTRLLQPSLSGNAQVVLVCCVSPLPSHIEESHNTFKFAVRAKKIPQKATIQETTDEKTLLQSYREEIEELKRQLKDARSQQDRSLQNTGHSTASTVSEVDEDEIAELVKSIQTMEKLILKSKPLTPSGQPEDLLDASDNADDAEEENLLALVSGDPVSMSSPNRPPVTPTRTIDSTDDELHAELTRVQGLLGSVLKKKKMADAAARANTNASEQEVRDLRAQLEEQEVASSLRKADASFLQQQLEEKDSLLQEVSKILEALEARQQKLEEENRLLRKQLALYTSRR